MSFLEPVNRKRIDQFLVRLGEEFRHPARIHLVGGASLIYEGFREQSLDIDLTLDVADEYHAELVRVIQDLKGGLSLNIDEVSPADFIPLPSGFESRAEFVGQYGQVVVYHFDFYSIALSKIERSSQLDRADVISLLNSSRITWPRLEYFFNEIIASYGEKSLRQEPERFRRNFERLKQAWISSNL